MYSETDIEAAIASGALTTEAAAALRASVARNRETSLVDEESFRLLTGFNDVFVSIAIILVLVAVGWIGHATGTIAGAFLIPFHQYSVIPFEMTMENEIIQNRHGGLGLTTGGLFVALASWGLSEYFINHRRMALPGILLLLAFVLSVFGLLVGLLIAGTSKLHPEFAQQSVVAALAAAFAAFMHWQRFHVPITIAALTAALTISLVSLAFSFVPEVRAAWFAVMLLAGIAVFAFAMWWDISDRARTTRRSDVAFWLHLLAAPLIAHPIFNLLGVLGDTIGPGTAIVVILLYVAFGVVALAVDRRALLVSGLVYVLYAIAGLFRQFGAVSLNVALTALVIGSALLLLSAFWHVARRKVVERLPGEWQARLPALDRPAPAAVSPRPA